MSENPAQSLPAPYRTDRSWRRLPQLDKRPVESLMRPYSTQPVRIRKRDWPILFSSLTP